MPEWLQLSSLSDVAGYWVWQAVDWSFKATVLLALAGIASSALRKSAPGVRHAVWGSALAGALALPVLSAVVPTWRLPVLPTVSVPAAISVAARDDVRLANRSDNGRIGQPTRGTNTSAPVRGPIDDTRQGMSRTDAPVISATSFPDAQRNIPWFVLAVVVWGIGASTLLLRLVLGVDRADRWVRAGREPSSSAWRHHLGTITRRLGLSREIRLVQSDGLDTAMTVGFLRPAVLIPPCADEWPDERRNMVLAHELVHVKRNDWIVQMLGHVSRALYWFNPLFWIAVRRLTEEREKACDDGVVALGAEPADYAAHLVDVARSLSAHPTPSAALPFVRRTRLEERLQSILASKGRPRRGVRVVLATMAGMMTLAFVVAGLRPWEELTATPLAVSNATSDLPNSIGPEPVRPSRVEPSAPTVQEPIFRTAQARCLESVSRAFRMGRGRGNFSGSVRRWVGPTGERISLRTGYFNGDFILERVFDDGFCMFAMIRDSVVFDRSDNTIDWMERGALVELATGTEETTQHVVVYGVRDGEMEYEWRVDGDPRQFDDEARRWTQATLAVLFDMREISELRGRKSTLRGRISTIRGHVSTLRGRISTLGGRRSTLRGRISTIRGRESTLRGRISTLRGRESTLRGRISTIRGRVSTMRGQISTLQAQRSRVGRQLQVVREYNDTAPDLKQRLELRQEEIDNRIRGIRDEMEDYDMAGRVARVEAEIATLRTSDRVAEVRDQIDVLATAEQIAAVERQIEELGTEDRVAEVEREIEQYEAERLIVEVERQIDELNADDRVERLQQDLELKYRELRRQSARIR